VCERLARAFGGARGALAVDASTRTTATVHVVSLAASFHGDTEGGMLRSLVAGSADADGNCVVDLIAGACGATGRLGEDCLFLTDGP